MTSMSLLELKRALTLLEISTVTGNQRGEARRQELARRLQHATLATSEATMGTQDGSDDEDGRLRPKLDTLSLLELRSALKLRQISTLTPGLKGEARRHALVQRLKTFYGTLQAQNDQGVREESDRDGIVPSDDDEVDDVASETSSSAYSTATELVCLDTLRSTVNSEAKEKLKATALVPRRTNVERDEAEIDSVHDQARERGVAQLQQKLVDLRTKLHESRQAKQQLIDRSLQDAGIDASLGEISAKIQALERERQRLQDNYFGHELVVFDVLGTSSQELVQSDALLLIKKRQDALKQQAKTIQAAMTIAKFHADEIESGISTSARGEEEGLLEQIRQVESSLCLLSTRGLSTEALVDQTALVAPLEDNQAAGMSVLGRHNSMREGLKAPSWEHMGAQERRQLHHKLRTAASFHIRRDRVLLRVPCNTRVPSQADKLGMKAQFMEKVKCNPDDIYRVYEKALELDSNHAQNLGNFARFVYECRGQVAQARSYFQQALTLDPMNALNLANYANFVMREHDDDAESFALFKRAREASPKDVDIMGRFVDCLCAQHSVHGRCEHLLEARQILMEALTLSPLHTSNQLRLALVLVDLKENELAARCFEQLIHAIKHPDLAKHLGLEHETMGSIYERYADFLHHDGKWVQAKCMYDEALALAPQWLSLVRKFSCFLRESRPFLSPRTLSSLIVSPSESGTTATQGR